MGKAVAQFLNCDLGCLHPALSAWCKSQLNSLLIRFLLTCTVRGSLRRTCHPFGKPGLCFLLLRVLAQLWLLGVFRGSESADRILSVSWSLTFTLIKNWKARKEIWVQCLILVETIGKLCTKAEVWMIIFVFFLGKFPRLEIRAGDKALK